MYYYCYFVDYVLYCADCESEKQLVGVEWITVVDSGARQLGQRLLISHAKVSN